MRCPDEGGMIVYCCKRDCQYCDYENGTCEADKIEISERECKTYTSSIDWDEYNWLKTEKEECE
jgi:hypothetical protein